jgi:hypothetical protein
MLPAAAPTSLLLLLRLGLPVVDNPKLLPFFYLSFFNSPPPKTQTKTKKNKKQQQQ